MWQGVEYTAAPGGMEEAIKNYCKKGNRRTAPVFSWEMYKNTCRSSFVRDHRDFQHEKRYDTNFMSYLLLPVKDYCFLPLHLPVPSMTFLKIAWSSSTDLPFSLAMATWRRADS